VILGLGTDWMEIGRVERELSRGEWTPEQGIFTAGEIRSCGAAAAPAAHYAACFAAKEAAMKALGVRVGDLRMYREVEVARARGDACEVILHDRLKAAAEQLGVRHIRFAISRSGREAGAVVILED
jgi:holo-[acyl-carrier protein] synthase